MIYQLYSLNHNMFVTPTHTLFYSIEKAIKTYRKFAQKRLNEVAADITLDQALLLLLIDENSMRSQVQMADALFKDEASLTRMIVLLVHNGYLQKTGHPNDGRRTRLSLTAKSKRTLEMLRPIIAANRRMALNNIPTKELDILENTLVALIDNCETSKKPDLKNV